MMSNDIPPGLSEREQERFLVLAIRSLDHHEEIPKGKILNRIERERDEDPARSTRVRQRNYERKLEGCV
ncbi:MAG: hypothetical protein ABEJ02_04660 [Candidatus Paceibacteria bacterium]